MDVGQYRRYKNLHGSQKLRDHMSDLELALTTLGETAAVAPQARESNSFSDLRADTEDAGRIVARTRKQVERLSNRSVVNASNPGTIGVDVSARAERPTQGFRRIAARPTRIARIETCETGPGYAEFVPIAPAMICGVVGIPQNASLKRPGAAWMPRN